MECNWVVRKKRSVRVEITTRTSTINNTFLAMEDLFNKLPKEIHIDIMKRLTEKDLSRFMCISKPWRNLILNSCIPAKPFSTLRHLGLLERLENEDKDKITSEWLSDLVDTIAPHPFPCIDRFFDWCFNVMCCKVKPKMIIDSCNGLFLFCHKDGKAHNLTLETYHYYVINPITKQCVAVLKPLPGSAPYLHASLAFDPTESRFFKIVRFQGCRHMNVFSSENGCWRSLTFQLPQRLSKDKWMPKSVYSKGAIYRLCKSGHMIKLHVDLQERVENQAVAIDLPRYSWLLDDYCHWDISIKGSVVIFVASFGKFLRVWELVEDFDDGFGYSFEWILTHGIDKEFLEKLNRDGMLLGIHPYYGVVFYKFENFICYYFYCYNTLGFRKITYDGCLYRYLKVAGFPFLECFNPFACCLDKEHPRLFQRLPIPKDCSAMHNLINQ